MPGRIKWSEVVTKERLLFISGLLLTMNEAVFRSGQERPAMLVLFAGMMGLPAFLKTGEEKKQAKTEYDNHVRMQDKEQPGNSSSLQRTRVQQLAWS